MTKKRREMALAALLLRSVMSVVGSVVIAGWRYHLMQDTGRMLLDVKADHDLSEKSRGLIESDSHD
jgi:hypothetical protein